MASCQTLPRMDGGRPLHQSSWVRFAFFLRGPVGQDGLPLARMPRQPLLLPQRLLQPREPCRRLSLHAPPRRFQYPRVLRLMSERLFCCLRGQV